MASNLRVDDQPEACVIWVQGFEFVGHLSTFCVASSDSRSGRWGLGLNVRDRGCNFGVDSPFAWPALRLLAPMFDILGALMFEI